jgi:hypothetical protein
MRIAAGLLMFLALLLPACSEGPDPVESLTGDRESALLMRREHELSWRDREETGNPADVEILLDGLLVGKGEEGMEDLRRLVRAMPSGTRIHVMPCSEDGQTRPHPLDRGFHDYCRRYGVVLK